VHRVRSLHYYCSFADILIRIWCRPVIALDFRRAKPTLNTNRSSLDRWFLGLPRRDGVRRSNSRSHITGARDLGCHLEAFAPRPHRHAIGHSSQMHPWVGDCRSGPVENHKQYGTSRAAAFGRTPDILHGTFHMGLHFVGKGDCLFSDSIARHLNSSLNTESPHRRCRSSGEIAYARMRERKLADSPLMKSAR
jgi:hypothetical protein